MKKETIRRLLAIPGARVSLSNNILKINDKPVTPPWFTDNTLEIGILTAMPRAGLPLVIDETDLLAFGRFIGPALFDTFTDPPTLRKFLNLPEAESGAYVTPIEKDSEGIARSIVDVLKGMKKGDDWQRRLNAGVASAMPDALSNSITVAGDASAWTRALVEAVEAAEAQAPVTAAAAPAGKKNDSPQARR